MAVMLSNYTVALTALPLLLAACTPASSTEGASTTEATTGSATFAGAGGADGATTTSTSATSSSTSGGGGAPTTTTTTTSDAGSTGSNASASAGGGGSLSSPWSSAYPTTRFARPLVDSDGNAVLVSFLPGPQDFGGGPAGEAGAQFIYVTKVNAAGKTVWTRAFPASDHAQPFVTVGPTGLIAVTGDYWGELRFDTKLTCTNTAGMPDAFVAVLDPNGAVLYSRCFDAPYIAQIFGSGFDAQGNLLLGASFALPQGAQASAAIPVSEDGISLSKFSPSGDLVWSKTFTSPDHEPDVQGLTVAPSGEVLIEASGSTLDLGAGPVGDPAGQSVFLAKFDPAGVGLWSRAVSVAPPFPPTVTWLETTLDVYGNAVGIGVFTGTLDVGLGPVTATDPRTFVAKFDAAGKPLWLRHFQGGVFRGIITDTAGAVLLTGEVESSMDLGAGALVSAGGKDVLLAKLAPTGETISALIYGDAGEQSGLAIGWFVATAGPTLGGTFEGTLSFSAGPLSGSRGPTFLSKP